MVVSKEVILITLTHFDDTVDGPACYRGGLQLHAAITHVRCRVRHIRPLLTLSVGDSVISSRLDYRC